MRVLAILVTVLLSLFLLLGVGGASAGELSAIRSLDVQGLELKALPERSEENLEAPERFYPSYKWVYGDKLIPLSHPPLLYKGEVFIELSDLERTLSILGVRNWSLERGNELPDGRVLAKFVYNDIPVKRYSFEPLFYNGVYVPFAAIRETIGYEMVIDEEHGRIWVVPSLKDIIVREDAVVIEFSGKLKIRKTFYLSNPLRFVIDLEDAAVTKDLFRKMELSEHKYLRGIRTSQFTVVPPVARIVLDLKPGAKVTRIARIKVNEIHIAFSDEYQAPLSKPVENPKPLKPGEKPIRIFQITPMKSGRNLAITITKDKGEVSYSVKELRDGRIYVDLYNSVLRVSKNTINVNYGGVEKIRYSQYQRKPVPIVRVVLYSKRAGELKVKHRSKSEMVLTYVRESSHEEVLDVGGLKGTVICIDPGHGGSDPGAQSPYINLDEKDVTLDIAKMLYAELRQAGLKPVLTRYTDRDVLSSDASDEMELEARVQIARKAKAKIFISIHVNASPNKYLNGVMTFYHKDEDYPLAHAIHTNLVRTGLFVDRGIRQANFYVLRRSQVPAVLIELGFLTNRDDAMKLASRTVRRRLALAIARGIVEYLTGKGELAE